MFSWFLDVGVLPILIPRIDSEKLQREFLLGLDALVFTGGTDISPDNYGEVVLNPEWVGDPERDCYELRLFDTAYAMNKPIFGICRGLQLINVALGGSLYQDTCTHKPDAHVHRDWEAYDSLMHKIQIQEDSSLAALFPGKSQMIVNSVHHQSIKFLAPELKVQAVSIPDGVIEAVEYTGQEQIIFATQWHPEWRSSSDMLDSTVILEYFLRNVASTTAKTF